MVDNPGRLLFVHAHPDDEALATGGTIARYSRAGHEVTVVTCTAGVAVPRGVLERELSAPAESVRAAGDERIIVDVDPSHCPDGCHDDAMIAVEVDIASLLDLTWAALAAYRTQLVLLDDRIWVLPRGR